MKKTTLLLTAMSVYMAFIVAGGAIAQDSFTLQNNGWQYTEMNLAGQRFGTSGGTSSLLPPGGTNQLVQNWWWYRNGGDTREYALSNLTSTTMLGANTERLMYLEPVNNGFTPNALSWTLDYTLTGTNTQNAAVTVNWSAKNNLNTAIPLDVFSYSNPELGPVPSDNTGTLQNFNSTQGTIRVQNPSTLATLDLKAGNSNLTGWQISPFNTMQTQLTDNIAQNLTNRDALLGPADITGGFQYHFASVAPGQTVSGMLTKTFSSGGGPIPPPIPDANTLVLVLPGAAYLLLRKRR